MWENNIRASRSRDSDTPEKRSEKEDDQKNDKKDKKNKNIPPGIHESRNLRTQRTQETKKPPSQSSREQESDNISLKSTYNQSKDFKHRENISPPRHQDSRMKNLATESLHHSFQKEPGNSNATEYKRTESENTKEMNFLKKNGNGLDNENERFHKDDE